MLKRKNKEAAEEPAKKRLGASNPQGITAKGNALYRIAGLALLASAVLVAAGFAYLIALREPTLQEIQIDRVAGSFATQQATSVHQLVSRIKRRMEGAARSPLAMSAIASESKDDLALVEQAMLDYFPEVISLRIIPMGEMGTADFEGGSQGLRNHIEIDLVRRAGTGEQTQPESYQFEGRWMTSLAALVTHPRVTGQQAVVVATIDNQLLSDALKSTDNSVGRFALEQVYVSSTGLERRDVIAMAGSGGATEFTRTVNLPESNWLVQFTPSRALVSELTLSPTPLFSVLALCLIALIGAVFFIVRVFSRVLDTQINKVISAADVKSPLELNLPGLVSIAKQLRRATLRTLRQSSSGNMSDIPKAKVEELPSTGSDLTNPMFQQGSIIDEDVDEGAGSIWICQKTVRWKTTRHPAKAVFPATSSARTTFAAMQSPS